MMTGVSAPLTKYTAYGKSTQQRSVCLLYDCGELAGILCDTLVKCVLNSAPSSSRLLSYQNAASRTSASAKGRTITSAIMRPMCACGPRVHEATHRERPAIAGPPWDHCDTQPIDHEGAAGANQAR